MESNFVGSFKGAKFEKGFFPPPPREKRVTWQESHCGESFTEVIVCMRVCTTRQYLCLTVRAAYSRAADRSMPSFCTSEEFVLLQLADFPSL